MATEKSTESESSFTRMLAWTVVLGLVFSAGLITGQRLLRADARGPMVSLSSTAIAKSRSATNADAAKPLRTTFSFYEHLTSSREARAEPAPDGESTPGVEDAPAAQEPPVVEEAPAEEPAEEALSDEATDEETVQATERATVKATETVPPVEPAGESPAEEADQADSGERRAPERVIDELVEAVRGEPKQTPPGTPGEESKPALPARYTLQVSSHPDRASAEREMTRLRRAGLEPHVISVDVPGRGKLWRIRIGKFHSMDEARSFQGSLDSRRGVAGFVTPL